MFPEADTEMLEDDNAATVSLDSESRVRGICQLMDGLISNIKAEANDDPSMRQDALLSMLGSAIEALDGYLTMGYSFMERYRERGLIGAKEERVLRGIMEEKRDSVVETLKKECEILGFLEVEE